MSLMLSDSNNLPPTTQNLKVILIKMSQDFIPIRNILLKGTMMVGECCHEQQVRVFITDSLTM